LGEKNLICIALLAYITRFIYYALLTNPWAVYPAELLHGITFAAMWSSSVSYAKSISPPGMSSTMQGILSATWQGIGCGTGNLLSGFLYYHIGPKPLYFATAGWCAFGLIFFFTSNKIQEILKLQKGGSTEQNTSEKVEEDIEPLVGGIQQPGYEGFPYRVSDEDDY